MSNRSEILKKQPRPMHDEQFADIELRIRSLRTEDLADEDEFIVVDFKKKLGSILFIQAMSVESFSKCRVEIAIEREGKSFPKIYARNDVPVNEVVQIFRRICCSADSPNLESWEYVTEEIMLDKGIEDT